VFNSTYFSKVLSHSKTFAYFLSQYSKCGRTDKGVSALANVISLWLRQVYSFSFYFSFFRSPAFSDYCKMLNHCLPPDIRILQYAPVPYDFDARFRSIKENLFLGLAVFLGNTIISFCKRIIIFHLCKGLLKFSRGHIILLISVNLQSILRQKKKRKSGLCSSSICN
jgi:tRNA pseudouridine(38-40) synthase